MEQLCNVRELLVACNVGISGSLDAAVEGTGTECHLSYRVSEFFYVPTPKLPPPELRRDQRPGQKEQFFGPLHDQFKLGRRLGKGGQIPLGDPVMGTDSAEGTVTTARVMA